MVCKSCGKNNPDGNPFCGNCGKALNEPQDVQMQVYQNIEAVKPKKNTFQVILVIITIILAILLAFKVIKNDVKEGTEYLDNAVYTYSVTITSKDSHQISGTIDFTGSLEGFVFTLNGTEDKYDGNWLINGKFEVTYKGESLGIIKYVNNEMDEEDLEAVITNMQIKKLDKAIEKIGEGVEKVFGFIERIKKLR